MDRTSRAIPVVLAALAFLGVAFWGLATRSDPTRPDALNPLPSDRTASRHSERWYDDARELPDIDSPSKLRPTIEKHFGDRFGGVWYNRDVSPTRLVFGATDVTEVDRSFVRDATVNDPRTDLIEVRYSELELDTFRDRMEPLVIRFAERFTIGTDPRFAVVYVEVTPIDYRWRERFADLGVPADAYVLTEGGGGTSVGSAS